jgi:putative transposase
MSQNIQRIHNISVFLYHLVFPTKYRRVVRDEELDKMIKGISLEIERRYEIHFVEIGTDKEHVHYLVQTVPMMAVNRLVAIIKSITVKEVFKKKPELKKELWGSSLWTSGYYASTVGKHGNEEVIGRYIQEQGHEGEYVPLHKD